MMTTSITSSRSQFDSKRISDGARWRRTYVNGFGETVSEEWPGFGDVLTQRLRDAEYDAKGSLVRGRPWGQRPNAWPDRKKYPGRWCHSDLKDVAYFYVFKFFDKVIEKGNLK